MFGWLLILAGVVAGVSGYGIAFEFAALVREYDLKRRYTKRGGG